MQRIIAAQTYSHDFEVQVRHALNDPYDSMVAQECIAPAARARYRDEQSMYDREADKARKALYAEYLDEIRSWNWSAIVDAATANREPNDDGDGYVGREYLGSVLSLYPSGKIYMPWTSNQTDYDVLRDEAFYSALETVADERGGWIENGEGDPCDVFFCVSVDCPEEQARC